METTKKIYKVFPLNELKPHPKNVAIYGEKEDVSDLIDLIKKFSLRDRIIVNEQGVIISGHRRYQALIELGYTEVECEVRHYDDEIGEISDLLNCNATRQKTNVQKLREGEEFRKIEEYKAKRRQATSTGGNNPSLRPKGAEAENEERGETRDIIAKKIKWGGNGKDYSYGRSALKKSDELRNEGKDDIADIIITQINKRGSRAAYDLAYKVDVDALNDLTLSGLRSGQISGRAKILPLKPEFDKSKKNEDAVVQETNFTNTNSKITRQDLEAVVQEYNAKSRGEIDIQIPELGKGYISKTLESAMMDFRKKVGQCMIHQREINNMSDEERTRLNNLMTRFIEDFEKDKTYIIGGN